MSQPKAMKSAIADSVRRILRGSAVKQGSIVLFDQGFLSIANFITGVLVARACSKEDYGLYVLAWSLLLIFSSILRAIVQVPFTVYIPRLSDQEKNVYQGSTLIHTLLTGSILALFVVAAPSLPFMQHGQWKQLSHIAPIVSILTLPFLLREFSRSALFARLNFFSSLAANATATFIQLVIVGTLYTLNRLGVINALAAILAGSLLAAVLMLWSHRDKMVIRLDKVFPDLVRGWGVSKWVLLNVVGMIGASQAFPWLLLSLMNAKAVAVYGAALAVAAVVSPLLRAVNAYVLPRMAHGFSEGNAATLKRMLNRSMLVLAIPYGTWTLLGSLYSEEILTILYTREYSGFGLTVALLLIKTMIESVSAPMTSTLFTLERSEITTKALFLGTLATLGIAPLAIIEFGVNGAASTAIFSSLVVSVYRYINIRRLIQAA